MCCKQSSVHRVCIHVHYVIHVAVVDPSASRSQVFVGRLIVCRRRAGEEILSVPLREVCCIWRRRRPRGSCTNYSKEVNDAFAEDYDS